MNQASIWSDEAALAREMAQEVALAVLPPSVVRIIEEAVPGAGPGDIESGRLVPMHVRQLATHVVLGYWLRGEAGFGSAEIEVFSPADVAELVRVIRLLAEWEAEEGAG